jgi:TldD protein
VYYTSECDFEGLDWLKRSCRQKGMIMFQYPEGLYTDVRIENVFHTQIGYTLGKMENCIVRNYQAAFIRIYDGSKWYYSALTDTDKIQSEIDSLARMAKPLPAIDSDPVVQKLQANTGDFLTFSGNSVSRIPKETKTSFCESLFPFVINRSLITLWNVYYSDSHKVKEIYSSKGANLRFDTQLAQFVIIIRLADGTRHHSGFFDKSAVDFMELPELSRDCTDFVSKSEEFLKHAEPVIPGTYPVVLSPHVAGVFAHESFGHRSEADFMMGDRQALNEWQIGKKIAADIVSIVDNGHIPGSGYVPFDDEGTRAEKTFLIRNGLLSGRLHSASTAAFFNEALTGNARALSYEFQPIVRMATTYFLPGDKTFGELISDIRNGFYIESCTHGSGLSRFTIAPLFAYKIENGKLGKNRRIFQSLQGICLKPWMISTGCQIISKS